MNEQQLEQEFIDILTKKENQWSYRSDLKTEKLMWQNLRHHVNRINKAKLDGDVLTDKEFAGLQIEFKRLTETPFKAAQWLRGENGIASIQIDREEITKGNISLELFSNKDIGGGISCYEVVNQVAPDSNSNLRGDVTLLINGLPIIHIELKAESAKDGYMQAFKQIKRYANSGFFDGIYATTQIFVVSNKVATKYFARPSANIDKAFDEAEKFLFNWRTPKNDPVENLFDFARQVLKIPHAHQLVSQFTVLVDDKKSQKYLMALRPYQIHAIKKISEQASKHEGGFIWHATGSGKTITSFVATKLLALMATGVDRTVMVVDRTDLDTQTKAEFGKFASEFHTGLSTGNVADNTLVVGVDSERELTKELLSKKNNNAIIVTTIQKLSAAIRKIKNSEINKFEKLKGEHIVFIVDEAHRAVSDEEMKEIKKYLPRSTWFGLTGTPIFEENQKQENGTFARTTHQQYGELLHAYTTKHAMDDKSVLDFQIEYHSLLKKEVEERYLCAKIQETNPNSDPLVELRRMSELEKEALFDNAIYESEDYIKEMLLKIFKRYAVMEKFQVKNGYPTMSAILTTHSIAQAKRIYHLLQKMKKSGELLTGNFLSPKNTLIDKDFPRVAITYSLSTDQSEMVQNSEEFAQIMQEYEAMFNTTIPDPDSYNRNVNNRLARKEEQYKKEGQWLDFVIVVDRLLTGFDAPTIQTLYVDRELKYQKLLQAFSRTNRILNHKKFGMIVTFRKPHTMRENVSTTMRLFSNEDQNWITLKPKEYVEVRLQFDEILQRFEAAKIALQEDPNDLKKKIEQVKAFQQLEKIHKALSSYDSYAEDFTELAPILETFTEEKGKCENLKAEIRSETAIEDEELMEELLQDIEFSSDLNATSEEIVDSFYIKSLLKDYQERKPEAEARLQEEISKKPDIVQSTYRDRVLPDRNNWNLAAEALTPYFTSAIDEIIAQAADKLQVPFNELRSSFNVYDPAKPEIPYIKEIIEHSGLDKETFEATFNEKYRKRLQVIEQYWKQIIEQQLLPLKGEL